MDTLTDALTILTIIRLEVANDTLFTATARMATLGEPTVTTHDELKIRKEITSILDSINRIQQAFLQRQISEVA